MPTAKTFVLKREFTGSYDGSSYEQCPLPQGGEEGSHWMDPKVRRLANEVCGRRRSGPGHNVTRHQNPAPPDNVLQSAACAVCGDRASGNFFGAIVCLPCKSFFIRCTKDGEPAVQKQCNGCCDVSKELRNRCQFCRFQRCLLIGMSRKEKPMVVHAAEGQELCRVCGDLANGVHFGIFTCEGCKKFFRRGLKEHKSYVCRGAQDCQVNPRNRNNCRACRFWKCAAVGMSRDAIKMGRPRKTFFQAKTDEDQADLPLSYFHHEQSDITPPTQLTALPDSKTPQRSLCRSPQRRSPEDEVRYPGWTTSVPYLPLLPEKPIGLYPWPARSESCSAGLLRSEPACAASEDVGRSQSLPNVQTLPTSVPLGPVQSASHSSAQVGENRTLASSNPYSLGFRASAPALTQLQPPPVSLRLNTDASTHSARAYKGSELPALEAPDHFVSTRLCDQMSWAPPASHDLHTERLSLMSPINDRVVRSRDIDGALDLSVRTNVVPGRKNGVSPRSYNAESPRVYSMQQRSQEDVASLLRATTRTESVVSEPGAFDDLERGIKISRMDSDSVHVENIRSNGGPGWAVSHRPITEATTHFVAQSDGPEDLSASDKLLQGSVLQSCRSCENVTETGNVSLSSLSSMQINSPCQSYYQWTSTKDNSDHCESSSWKVPAALVPNLHPEMSASISFNRGLGINRTSRETLRMEECAEINYFDSTSKLPRDVLMSEHMTIIPSLSNQNAQHASERFPSISHFPGRVRQEKVIGPSNNCHSSPSEHSQLRYQPRGEEQPTITPRHFAPFVNEDEIRALKDISDIVHTVLATSERQRSRSQETPAHSKIQVPEELIQTRLGFNLVKLREYWDKTLKLLNVPAPVDGDYENPDIFKLIARDIVTSYEKLKKTTNKLDVDSNRPDGLWFCREEEQNCLQTHMPCNVRAESRFPFALPGSLQGGREALINIIIPFLEQKGVAPMDIET